MTNDIATLRRLLGLTTPAPWVADSPLGTDWLVKRVGDNLAVAGYIEPNDARFIAAMRNTLPGLLDRIEELEGLLSNQLRHHCFPDVHDGGPCNICEDSRQALTRSTGDE